MKVTAALIVMALLLLSTAATARTSLSDVDAKLDQLLTQTAGTQCAIAHRFVGFSERRIRGSDGPTGRLHAICANEYPGSRMCMARETQLSAQNDDVTSNASGWVLGKFQLVPNVSDPVRPFLAVEESGHALGASNAQALTLNCDDFTAADSAFGMLLNARVGAGRMLQFFSCSADLQVACCAPEPICPTAQSTQ